MAVPTAASAKNNYPTFPPVLSYEEKEALTDEEKAERTAQNKAAQEELVRAYKNGEYDWDFNIDGAIDFTDASFVMWRYVEFSTTTELLNITPIQRAKIDEVLRIAAETKGDANGDGIINASDASYVLAEYSRRATE